MTPLQCSAPPRVVLKNWDCPGFRGLHSHASKLAMESCPSLVDENSGNSAPHWLSRISLGLGAGCPGFKSTTTTPYITHITICFWTERSPFVRGMIRMCAPTTSASAPLRTIATRCHTPSTYRGKGSQASFPWPSVDLLYCEPRLPLSLLFTHFGAFIVFWT